VFDPWRAKANTVLRQLGDIRRNPPRPRLLEDRSRGLFASCGILVFDPLAFAA
jgi:hypothetical protein